MKKKLVKLLDKKKLKFNEPLATHTTFKIGGPAAFFYEAERIKDLTRAVRVAAKLSLDFFILGGGSNLLVSDRGYNGLVIKNKTGGRKLLKNEKIEAESGVRLSKLIDFSLNHNLVGLEDFVMIPGTVGGAVFCNIHGLNFLFDKFIKEALVLTKRGEIKKVKNAWFKFSYDYSILQEDGGVVLKVIFKLKPGKREEACKKMQEIMQKKGKYPKLSAGCIFRNLPDKSVGFLIDKKLGLKGKKIGQARISPIHAGFIENLGDARAVEVMKLIKLIQGEARNKLGITFKPEIVFLGFTKKELKDAKIPY